MKGYVARLRGLDPPHSIGHNPLGGWMIILLLATLGDIIATGLFAAGEDAAGPLAGTVPLQLAELSGDLHGLISSFLMALVFVHLAGVAAEWFLTRNNLVKPMLTGHKLLSPAAAALVAFPRFPLACLAGSPALPRLGGGSCDLHGFHAKSRHAPTDEPSTLRTNSSGARRDDPRRKADFRAVKLGGWAAIGRPSAGVRLR